MDNRALIVESWQRGELTDRQAEDQLDYLDMCVAEARRRKRGGLWVRLWRLFECLGRRETLDRET